MQNDFFHSNDKKEELRDEANAIHPIDADSSDAYPEDIAKEASEHPEYYFARPSKKVSPALKIAALVSIAILVFSVVLRFSLEAHPTAAEFFYRYVTRYFQAAMAFLTSWIPFSLAETLFVLLPVVLILLFVLSLKYVIQGRNYSLNKMCISLVIAVSLLFSNYILNLSVLYCRPSLSTLSGISDETPTEQELCAASLIAVIRLASLTATDRIQYDTDGASVCPYSYDELDKRIDKAFDGYAEKNSWMSPYGARSKIIALSDVMTFTHISGVYTPYTGESNININYPDYTICATIAHEKAHMRGIAPEDEANIVAFFVLAESGDPYLEYCGYMSVLTNLLNDCYAAYPDFYTRYLYPNIPAEVIGEFMAGMSFFKTYEDSAASKVADTVNDTYLKINGEKDGIKSYDMMTDMVTSYLVGKKNR